MNYHKLAIKVLIADLIIFIVLLCIAVCIINMFPAVAKYLLPFVFSFLFLIDGILITCWKGDLLNKEHKNSTGYLVTIWRLGSGYTVGAILFIYAIINLLTV